MTSSASNIETSLVGSSILDKVFRDRSFVPGQSKAVSAGRDGAIDDLHRFGNDCTCDVEIFGSVRGRGEGEHMSAGFGEQMARHRNWGGFGLSGDAEPAGDAADLHQVGHDEVAGGCPDGFGKAAWKPPVLPGLNRYRRRLADLCMAL